MAVSIRLGSLKKIHAENVVKGIECYDIDGVIYVTTNFLTMLFGISTRQVGNLKKKGLETTEFSIANMNLYDLGYAVNWYEANVRKEQSKAGKKEGRNKAEQGGTNEENTDGTKKGFEDNGQQKFDFTGVPVESLPWDELDRRKKIQELKLAQRKNEIEEGLYIPIEDSDIAMAELAGTLISMLGNLRDIIPTEAEHQDRDAIVNILDFQFKDMIDELRKIVENTVKENPAPTVFQVLMSIIRQTNRGVCSIEMKKTIEAMEIEVQDKNNSKG
jgi:hypothetical protein